MESNPNPVANEQGKSKDEQLEASQRTCQVCICNKFGDDLKNISLRHRMHNEGTGEEYIKVEHLPFGKTSPSQLIHYMTGIGSGFDYWYIHLEDTTGQTYHCKDNFYCNLTSGDEKKLITVTLRKHEMNLDMPSGGCRVSLM